MADFTSILNKTSDTIEKPKPKPIGTYLSAIQGMPKQKDVTVQNEERAVLSFSIKLISAAADVDQEALAEAGEISAWPSKNKDIWIDSPEGEFQLKQFLTEHLGIDPMDGKKSKTLGQMCAEAPGRQLMSTIKHRPYQDKSTGTPVIAWEIGATAAV